MIFVDDDMCKLTCVADGSNTIVTFDSLVDNGTPCFYGESNFICLDGACEVRRYTTDN